MSEAQNFCTSSDTKARGRRGRILLYCRDILGYSAISWDWLTKIEVRRRQGYATFRGGGSRGQEEKRST